LQPNTPEKIRATLIGGAALAKGKPRRAALHAPQTPAINAPYEGELQQSDFERQLEDSETLHGTSR
jgi:hypothetical protein